MRAPRGIGLGRGVLIGLLGAVIGLALVACGAELVGRPEAVLGEQASRQPLPVQSVSPAADAQVVPPDRPLVVTLNRSDPQWERAREWLSEGGYGLLLAGGDQPILFRPRDGGGGEDKEGDEEDEDERRRGSGYQVSRDLVFDEAAGTITVRPGTLALATQYTATLAGMDTLQQVLRGREPSRGQQLYRWSFSTSAAPVTGSSTAVSADPAGTTTAAVADVQATATGAGEFTVAPFADNPAGATAFPATGFFDVFVAPGSSFQQLTVSRCNLDRATRAYWWAGTTWEPTSNQTFDSATGCVTITVDNGTSPSLADLTGTPIATAPAPPTVSAVSPNHGPDTGGTTVVITGTGFTDASSVAFTGGRAGEARFTVDSDTQITAVSPAGSISPEGSGTYYVVVTTPAGTSQATSASEFTYIAAPRTPDPGTGPAPPRYGPFPEHLTATAAAGATARAMTATAVPSPTPTGTMTPEPAATTTPSPTDTPQSAQ